MVQVAIDNDFRVVATQKHREAHVLPPKSVEPPKQRSPVPSTDHLSSTRARIADMLRRYVPEVLSPLHPQALVMDAVMAKHAGREDAFLQELIKRYGPEPASTARPPPPVNARAEAPTSTRSASKPHVDPMGDVDISDWVVEDKDWTDDESDDDNDAQVPVPRASYVDNLIREFPEIRSIFGDSISRFIDLLSKQPITFGALEDGTTAEKKALLEKAVHLFYARE